MTLRPTPDPKSSLWALIAHHLRFCRMQRRLTGELMGEIMHCSKSTVSRVETGEIMHCSKSTVSRVETGEIKLEPDQATAIDRQWETGGLFSYLHWYATLGHTPDWFRQYVDLEERASVIRIWRQSLIPGLLQTPDYARTGLISGGVKDLEEVLDERLSRQKILDREDPPVLWVLLSESLLELPCGGAAVMKAQLAHILDMSERPNIGVRVVPKCAGHHPGLDGSFMILTMAEPHAEVAYVEAPGGGRLVPNITEVASYALRYERIGYQALPEQPSRDLIRRIMEDM